MGKKSIIIIIVTMIISMGLGLGVGIITNSHDTPGKDGREIEMKVEDGYVKWQYTGTNEWINLISLSDLEGEKGEQGLTGEVGKNGKEVEIIVENGFIKWSYVGDNTWYDLIELSSLKGDKGEQGNEGQEVELKVEDGYVKWQYVGSDEWNNLISLIELKGDQGDEGTSGKEVELKAEDGYIKWHYVGESTWINLIQLSDLKGDKGDQGAEGTSGKEVELKVEDGYIKWHYVGDSTWSNLISLLELKGEQGESGTAAKQIELKTEDGYIKWSYEGENAWQNLVELSILKGEKGDDGLSAYEIYLKYHSEYNKPEEVWLQELVNGTIMEKTEQTVTFMVDGIEYQSSKVKFGTKVIKPENPTKEGYTFVEWQDENGDRWVFNGYTVEKDLILFAVFEYNYSIVTFNSLGGLIDTTEEKYVYGDDVVLPTPTKIGYDFDGWYYNDTLVQSGAWQYHDNMSLVAKYTAKKYTITLNENGGTLSESNIVELSYGEKYSLPVCTSPSTAPFAGWFYNDNILTNEDGKSNDVWLITNNVTLVAEYFNPIYDVIDLQNISNDLSGHYRLMNDIDLEGVDWEPIGSYNSPFSGVLDGNGYTLNNLYITKHSYYSYKGSSYPNYTYSYYDVGLFADISSAKIMNLNFDNCTINPNKSIGDYSYTYMRAGIVAGKSSDSEILNIEISNSSISLTQKCNVYAGLVGYSSDSTFNKNNVQMHILSVKGSGLGGIVGYFDDGVISNSTVKLNISSPGNIGGIIGLSSGGTIEKATVNVKFSNATYAGGIIGDLSSESFIIRQVSVSGDISNTTDYGGFVGITHANTSIERCASSINAYAIGYVRSTVSLANCYISSNYGFADYIYNDTVKVTNSYCMGSKSYKEKYSTSVKEPQLINSLCIGSIEDKSLLTKEYYIDTLGWNPQYWNFDNVSNDGYVLPLLK